VGKSTLASMVRSELEKRKVTLNRHKELRFRDKALIELSSLPHRWRSNLDFLTWRPFSLADLRTLRRRFRRFQVHTRRWANSSGVYLVDEGVCQLMLVVHQKTAQKDMPVISRTLAKYLPFPDIVIYVKASKEVIEARRRMRGNARDMLRLRTTRAGREGRRRLADLLSRLARADRNFSLIEVHNDDLDTLEQTASEVADQIVRLCRNPKTTACASPVLRLSTDPQ
jgi:deoxyadenosine/deoxycytidine kinase